MRRIICLAQNNSPNELRHFINAGRGPVVDECMVAALQKSEIHAPGLDVFEQEPLSVDSPLLSMANVVAVPHIGSATHETRYGMAACAVDNLIDALQGKVEKNCANRTSRTKPRLREVKPDNRSGFYSLLGCSNCCSPG